VKHGSPVVGTTTVQDVVVVDYQVTGPFVREANRAQGELSFRLVEDAIVDAKRSIGDELRVDAVVTGPISKLAWQMAGRAQYPGHTELFATRVGAKRFGMLFVSPRLRVMLTTIHLPLMDIRNVLTIGKVFDAIDLGNEAVKRMGVNRPRVAVCGLNPHAGEGGLLGDEETRIIEPAIRAASEQGIDARGPFPGDTIFNAAVKGEHDLVVAMYHDQGLIPLKLLDRDRAVNITVGLPVVRTSPDHGTAFDIAGKNRADPGSMRAAVEAAAEMVCRAT
jgi:4-hydroxythreonine-4-phosphate dehydrogenase